jgi:hypothetical protein
VTACRVTIFRVEEQSKQELNTVFAMSAVPLMTFKIVGLTKWVSIAVTFQASIREVLG